MGGRRSVNLVANSRRLPSLGWPGGFEWQMPPVLDLSMAVVAVRALGISRAVLHYGERLAAHASALRSAATARAGLYSRLADGALPTPPRYCTAVNWWHPWRC